MERMEVDRENAIERTSKLMLQGWALMNMMCPICNSALLTLKKTGKMQCPGCDMPVMFEGSVNAGREIPSSSPPKEAAINNTSPLKSPPTFSHHNTAAKKDNDNSNEMESAAKPFQSLEEMKKEYDATQQRRQDVSALLGDRMLSGWAMLGINCENVDCGTPLMRKPRSEEMECVNCGALYKEIEDRLVTIKSGHAMLVREKRSNSVSEYSHEKVAGREEAQLQGQSVAEKENSATREDILDMNDAPILNFSAPIGGDSSSKIAQKLLMGWALLDEECCGVPLMRDMTGVKRCVECGGDSDATDSPKQLSRDLSGGSIDDYDDEGDEEAYRNYARKRFTAAMAGADPTRVPRPPPSASSQGLRDEPIDTAHKAMTATANPVATAKTAPKVKDNSRRGEQLNSDRASVDDTHGILSAVKKKMVWCADALQKCEHVGDSILLAELISKLALAAKAVTDVEPFLANG